MGRRGDGQEFRKSFYNPKDHVIQDVMHTSFLRCAAGPLNEAVRTFPENCIPISYNSIRNRVRRVNKNQQMSDTLALRQRGRGILVASEGN